MAFGDKIRVVQSGKRRIKLFADFWNIVINARNQCSSFDVEVDWNKLSQQLVDSTRQGHFDETIGELAGCYIFGSVAISNPKEKEFVEKVLDQYGSTPGLFFNFAQRVRKQHSITCPHCSEKIRANSESGVDVLLTVEMIKHAAMREHEYLGIISSDRDFLPLLSYLRDQGQRVVHVATGSPDREMRSVTWSQIDLTEHYVNFCKIRHEGYIILTTPNKSQAVEEIISASPVTRDKINVIDITDINQISDKDLDFILRNMNVYWKYTNIESNKSLAHYAISDSVGKFRDLVANNIIEGNMPYVLRNGETELYYNNNTEYHWIRMYGQDYDERWQKLFENN